MPSAPTQLYSFPGQLGRRGTTMAAVFGLHILLAIGLIAGMKLRPPVPVTATPPPPTIVKEPPAHVAPVRPPTGLDLNRVLPRVEPPDIPDLKRTPDAIVIPSTPIPVVSGDSVEPVVAVSGVRVLRGDRPFYPAALRRAGKEGSVGVRVRVGATGRAELVEVADSSGFTAFDTSAVEAVKRWIFTPAQTATGPITSWVTFKVTFRLTD